MNFNHNCKLEKITLEIMLNYSVNKLYSIQKIDAIITIVTVKLKFNVL